MQDSRDNLSKKQLWTDVNSLARSLDTTVETLLYWRSNKSRYVRVETELVGSKERELAKPRGDFKRLLKDIDRQLKKYPLPPYFFGSRKGASAIDSALVHRDSAYILKIDLKRFFPKTTHHRVKNALSQLTSDDKTTNLLTELCTYDHRLPQGFPTSSTIAELVLLPLGRRLRGLCDTYNLKLSIYIDDICISGGHILNDLEVKILDLFRDMRYKWNPEKKMLVSVDNGITITGVLLKDGHATTKPQFDEEVEQDIWLYKFAQWCGDTARARNILETLHGRLQWMSQVDPKKAKWYKGLLGKATEQIPSVR